MSAQVFGRRELTNEEHLTPAFRSRLDGRTLGPVWDTTNPKRQLRLCFALFFPERPGVGSSPLSLYGERLPALPPADRAANARPDKAARRAPSDIVPCFLCPTSWPFALLVATGGRTMGKKDKYYITLPNGSKAELHNGDKGARIVWVASVLPPPGCARALGDACNSHMPSPWPPGCERPQHGCSSPAALLPLRAASRAASLPCGVSCGGACMAASAHSVRLDRGAGRAAGGLRGGIARHRVACRRRSHSQRAPTSGAVRVRSQGS